MSTLRHILVATDFNVGSSRALEAAVDLSALFDAKLTVVHVLEPAPYPYPIAAAVPLPTIPMNGVRPGRLQQLDDTVAALRARGATVTTQGVLRDGSPWREIISAARELGAELIVVGSHGRHGVPRWLLGSVAERVVRMSPIPVLTIRPDAVAVAVDVAPATSR